MVIDDPFSQAGDEQVVLGHEYSIATATSNATALAENGAKPKIPLKHIKCDGCTVTVGQVFEDDKVVHEGVPYYVHRDEWIKVMPVMTVLEVMALAKLQATTSDVGKIDEAFSDLCKELSLRVVEWNWTDMMGETLPQPFQRPDVIARLTTDEVIWLTNAMYEPVEDRKND